MTGWKKGAFKAIGLEEPTDHDTRYLQADEYLRVLYKYILPLFPFWIDDTNDLVDCGKGPGQIMPLSKMSKTMYTPIPTGFAR